MSKAQPKKCFLISPIGSPGSSTRLAADFFLKGIAQEAFKLVDFEIESKRADEINSPSLITSNVINAIIGSDFIIADLSELNPNVFYELGIAHSNEKPIIHCANDKTVLPFDNKDYNTIFYNMADWNSIENARNSISSHIKEIFSDNYVVSNPITHALGLRNIQNSADSRDRIIAEMSAKIEKIENIINNNSHQGAIYPNFQIPSKRDSMNINAFSIIDMLKSSIHRVAFQNSIYLTEENAMDLTEKYIMSLDSASVNQIIVGINSELNQMVLDDIRGLGR